MIRNFWRNFIFERELDKNLSMKSLDKEFKIKSVAILVDPKLEVEARFFMDLAADLNLPKVKMNLMLLNKTIEIVDEHPQTLNLTELNYWSSFKGDLLNFCQSEYDLLINYYNKSNSIYSLISTRTKAKMSVGFVGVDSRINDIIFDFDPKDKHTFKKELLKYMTILNKI
ncbi:DUF6913 domain-containing protein [Candidatus Arcticimaribacter forsetii]|uniref:DUF6913 domain-containing protein n=1 Tax=Candidatus Arcticimaribacter forsetii TaxID=2820661 RepID=UPI0020776046|nr:hypothetical protein [Candidatus Arcticimaribacter forsetii]MDB4674215.1 hypothetical protein [Flavobacteriaceae bacterium]